MEVAAAELPASAQDRVARLSRFEPSSGQSAAPKARLSKRVVVWLKPYPDTGPCLARGGRLGEAGIAVVATTKG